MNKVMLIKLLIVIGIMTVINAAWVLMEFLGISQEITHSSGCPYSVRSMASFAKQSTRSASKTERIRSAAEPTSLKEKNQCSVLDGQVSAFDGR